MLSVSRMSQVETFQKRTKGKREPKLMPQKTHEFGVGWGVEFRVSGSGFRVFGAMVCDRVRARAPGFILNPT